MLCFLFVFVNLLWTFFVVNITLLKLLFPNRRCQSESDSNEQVHDVFATKQQTVYWTSNATKTGHMHPVQHMQKTENQRSVV